MSLLIEITNQAFGFKGEGSVEYLTVSQPGEGGSGPPIIPPGANKDILPSVTPVGYFVLTRAEVDALPGAAEFLPAFQDALILKASESLAPPEEIPTPEPLPIIP
jgi:hypothetical protein